MMNKQQQQSRPEFRIIYDADLGKYQAEARLGADSYIVAGGFMDTEQEAWQALFGFLQCEVTRYLDEAFLGKAETFVIDRFGYFAGDGTMTYHERK